MRKAFKTAGRFIHPILLVAIAANATGCSKRRVLAPVAGKVTYQGKPLSFGAVIFQPERGQPAIGEIRSDGSFTMTTRGEGEGAAVGENQVRIVCYQGQDPTRTAADGQSESLLGKPLIPARYVSCDTSGIVVNVRPGANEPVLLELTNQ